MHIVVVGLNHKVAPVEVRERLSIGQADLPEALAGLQKHVREGVILSTCNRTEIYGLSSHPGTGARSLRAFFGEHRDLPLSEFDLFLYSHHELEAVRHLFRVAAGLDSMIVGEPQILGQVRQAYEAAETGGCTGPVLSTLFRQAITAGKRVQTETDISRHAASVSYAAVELARKIFGDLKTRTALIVGAGEMAELALQTLVDNGVGRVMVANRTQQRAVDLAAQFNGQATDLSRLDSVLPQADIVISSTAASGYVLTVPMLRAAMRARGHRPLFLIDIAVPRDIDPEVQRQENVFLYNVDDLEAVCQANLQERAKEAKKAEAIIEAEAAKFQAWWSSLEVVPTITALRAWAEEIRKAELSKAMSRLHGLSERDQNTINALTIGIVNKMLHTPIVGLKNDGHRYIEAVRELFRLDEGQR
ncbi:MAG: glutamyl-tRNA reductase [Bacteroidetes bacterium]|nr:glutamyl-tRNA reductase [Bacteroidota bacterium]